jgi:cyclic pyranopterin phosphate synthase
VFTHIDQNGRPKMVEVGDKEDTVRVAIARGSIQLDPKTLEMVKEGKMKKGDVLSVAQVAGIMGAKKTSETIPMCHNILITGVDMDFKIDDKKSMIHIEACVKMKGKTGVEMEALNSVSVAALTIYDMCKAVDKNMMITDIRLVKKTGGKSGTYIRKGEEI